MGDRLETVSFCLICLTMLVGGIAAGFGDYEVATYLTAVAIFLRVNVR